jgi:hypothetical protein
LTRPAGETARARARDIRMPSARVKPLTPMTDSMFLADNTA